MKNSLEEKFKESKEHSRKYFVVFFGLSILTLKLDSFTRKKFISLIELFDNSIAQDLKDELVKMVPRDDKEKIKAKIS